MTKTFFTSESVTEGHPDKIADQISDAILDNLLAKDPGARVAAETSITTGFVLVSGEITTTCYVDIPKVVRNTILEIGYNRAKYGFDGETCGILTSIDEQSPDIAQGVDRAYEKREKGMTDEEIDQIGAGDQGMMFGFATNETEDYMPLPISLAHRLTKQLSLVRHAEELPYLRPDGKSQVTVEYDNGKPVRVDTVVVSTQHSAKVTYDQLVNDVKEHVIKAVVPSEYLDDNTTILINPTGRFVVGGPQGDAGLTGRKIIVDTYGGYSRHGGGAFSGKDSTKVDRSASYAARYAAKNIVAAGLADKCELQVSYAIGVANPINIMVDTFGTNKIANNKIEELVRETFDLRPAAIIGDLDLRRPIYRQVACYGHFGRSELDVPWEKLDKKEILQEKAKKYFGV